MNDTAHSGAPIVYKPKDWSGARVLIPSIVLLAFCVLLIISSIASHSWLGLLGVLGFALVLLWFLSTLRKRATLTADELVVQGRFARVRVPLASITAVHQQDPRGLIVWVAAAGERPFRVYFVVGYPDFVPQVRARAAACGAVLDGDELVAAPPAGTRLFFTAL